MLEFSVNNNKKKGPGRWRGRRRMGEEGEGGTRGVQWCGQFRGEASVLAVATLTVAPGF